MRQRANGAMTTSEITIALPFPPSVNHYWRSVTMGKRKAVLISKPGREFAGAVAGSVSRLRLQTLQGPVAVAVLLCPPDKRRRDLDNFGGKALLDALTKAKVWSDDSQVVRLSMEWGPRVKGGRAVVRIAAV